MNGLERQREIIDGIDAQMASLFEKRMECAARIAGYKKENNIPLQDLTREKEILGKNAERISDERIKPYYRRFMKCCIKLSKEYQGE